MCCSCWSTGYTLANKTDVDVILMARMAWDIINYKTQHQFNNKSSGRKALHTTRTQWLVRGGLSINAFITEENILQIKWLTVAAGSHFLVSWALISPFPKWGGRRSLGHLRFQMPALLYLLPEDLPTRRAAVPHPSWTHLEASGIKHSESVLTKVNTKLFRNHWDWGPSPSCKQPLTNAAFGA